MITYLKLKSLFALNISFILYEAFKGVVVDQAILRKLIVKNINETDAVLKNGYFLYFLQKVTLKKTGKYS